MNWKIKKYKESLIWLYKPALPQKVNGRKDRKETSGEDKEGRVETDTG
jgi:hypothetical protein